VEDFAVALAVLGDVGCEVGSEVASAVEAVAVDSDMPVQVQAVISLIRIFTPIILAPISKLLLLLGCGWMPTAVGMVVVAVVVAAAAAAELEDIQMLGTQNRNPANRSWFAMYVDLSLCVDEALVDVLVKLPWSTANEDLVELFETTGQVELAEILFDGTRSKGCGVVQFAQVAEAETAIGSSLNFSALPPPP
jgi:hypothetical protein